MARLVRYPKPLRCSDLESLMRSALACLVLGTSLVVALPAGAQYGDGRGFGAGGGGGGYGRSGGYRAGMGRAGAYGRGGGMGPGGGGMGPGGRMGGGGARIEACRQEARRVFRPGKVAGDRGGGPNRELIRGYVRDCMQRGSR